jgi:hypothetical protein
VGVPKGCKCAEEFCCEGRCHAKTIFRWRGDYDFTNHLALAEFPGYREALDTSQPTPTSMVWRIRWDLGDLDFLHWMIDNDLTTNAGAVIDARPVGIGLPSNNIFTLIPAMGAVRGGIMLAGSRSKYHYFNSISIYNTGGFPNFIGEMVSYVTAPPPSSSPLSTPVEHPQFAHHIGLPTFTGPISWALDIGCVRCGYSHNSITWPPVESVSYVPATTAFYQWFKTPEHRVLMKSRVLERCNDMDPGEQAAADWAGDAADSRQAPPCVPELIMWHHDWRRVINSLNDFNPPTAKTAIYRGWARPVGENSDTFLHTHADNTDVIVLLGDRRFSPQPENADLTGDQITALSDWLSLGGKTLIITHPGIFVDDYVIAPGDPGGLLAGIGSTMRIGSASTSWISYDFQGSGVVEHWQATADPLATNLPANFQRPKIINGDAVNSGYSVYYVDGGTPLLNAVRTGFGVITNPIVSYETLTSGSRVVLYGMARGYLNNVPDQSGGSSGTVVQTVKDIAANALAGL